MLHIFLTEPEPELLGSNFFFRAGAGAFRAGAGAFRAGAGAFRGKAYRPFLDLELLRYMFFLVQTKNMSLGFSFQRSF